MSASRAPSERGGRAASDEDARLWTPRTVHRRRAAAARVRRRRLAFADLALGLALALLAIAIAPGLAVVAIVALLVLLGCAAFLLYGRVRERRSIEARRAHERTLRAANGAPMRRPPRRG